MAARRRLPYLLQGAACPQSRRSARERAAAVSERNGHAVADSAWDRALAAVHEEVGRLPESLRVPFVLCCLEGKGATEAAEQLGWKLGTLSGRLTRAKDAVLARLDARGLTLGAIAAPRPGRAAGHRAGEGGRTGESRLRDPGFDPSTLSGSDRYEHVIVQGVGGRRAGRVRTGCGGRIGLGGYRRSPDATRERSGAEDGPRRRGEATPDGIRSGDPGRGGRPGRRQQNADAVKTLRQAVQKRLAAQAEQDYAKLAAQFLAQAHDPKETYTAKTKKWEYDFVVVSDMTQSKFVAFLQDRENRGWEYNGTTTLTHQGKPTEIWVFRRPAKGAEGYTELLNHYYKRVADTQQHAPQALQHFQQRMRDGAPADKAASDPKNAEAIAREIARLQDQLAKLNAKPMMDRVVVPPKELPLEPTEMLSSSASSPRRSSRRIVIRSPHRARGSRSTGTRKSSTGAGR